MPTVFIVVVVVFHHALTRHTLSPLAVMILTGGSLASRCVLQFLYLASHSFSRLVFFLSLRTLCLLMGHSVQPSRADTLYDRAFRPL